MTTQASSQKGQPPAGQAWPLGTPTLSSSSTGRVTGAPGCGGPAGAFAATCSTVVSPQQLPPCHHRLACFPLQQHGMADEAFHQVY